MINAKKLFPDAPYAIQQDFDRIIRLYGADFGLETKHDYAAFFATIIAEVGTNASIKTENFNYSAKGLKKTFKIFRENPELADKLGRSSTQKANRELIANYAYADRMGNGSVESGDGWKYRGRGFIQLTGKYNYAVINDVIKEITGADFMLLEYPEIVGISTGAAISALAYWNLHGLSGKNIDYVTDKVNRYTDSRRKRQKLYASILTELVVKSA